MHLHFDNFLTIGRTGILTFSEVIVCWNWQYGNFFYCKGFLCYKASNLLQILYHMCSSISILFRKFSHFLKLLWKFPMLKLAEWQFSQFSEVVTKVYSRASFSNNLSDTTSRNVKTTFSKSSVLQFAGEHFSKFHRLDPKHLTTAVWARNIESKLLNGNMRLTLFLLHISFFFMAFLIVVYWWLPKNYW